MTNMVPGGLSSQKKIHDDMQDMIANGIRVGQSHFVLSDVGTFLEA